MAQNSKIEWCESTWNPATGCTKVSPGCAHCYIERTPPFRVNRRRFDAKGAIPIQLHPERLTQPLRWKRPRRVFVNSLSDLFHEDISQLADEFIAAVFGIMAITPQHTYQVLTKRPERMLAFFKDVSGDPGAKIADATAGIIDEAELDIDAEDLDSRIANYINGFSRIGSDDGNPLNGTVKRWPLPNVWLGVTAENQRFADERTAVLREVPAAVHFISYEPALELVAFDLRGIDWLICGGESGPGARPMHPDWARSARDQCVAAGVPFFFKQWGEYGPNHFGVNDALPYAKLGKKAAGRILDFREWNEYPKGS